jgi:hypothetical protein
VGRQFDVIDDRLAAWVRDQHVFFVSTAPSEGGHVNCSPKGLDSLAVVGPTTLAYVDLTGSGVETIAHLRDNGRICIMLCAFQGPPRIVRFQGTGEVLEPSDPAFADLAGRFPSHPGVRAIIRVECERIADSCGHGVPLMTFEADRDVMPRWATRKGPAGIATYQAQRNAVSIDGLPGLPSVSP